MVTYGPTDFFFLKIAVCPFEPRITFQNYFCLIYKINISILVYVYRTLDQPFFDILLRKFVVLECSIQK